MKNRLYEYRHICDKAVEYQIIFQLPDGGYFWYGYAIDAFFKQVLTFQHSGHFVET